MADSTFRLQPVLSYKERLEEALQLELNALEKACQKEKDNLDALVNEKRSHMLWLRAQWLGVKPEIEVIKISFQYLGELVKRMESQVIVVENLRTQVQRKRTGIIEIAQSRKTLEKLKEKHRIEWLKKLADLESKNLDELAAIRRHRQKGSAEGG